MLRFIDREKQDCDVDLQPQRIPVKLLPFTTTLQVSVWLDGRTSLYVVCYELTKGRPQMTPSW